MGLAAFVHLELELGVTFCELGEQPLEASLCGGKLARSFALRVLEKYDVTMIGATADAIDLIRNDRHRAADGRPPGGDRRAPLGPLELLGDQCQRGREHGRTRRRRRSPCPNIC